MTDDKRNTISLDMHRFKTLISAHGSNIAKWPEDSRNWALAYSSDNKEAQKFISFEKELDDVLEDIHKTTIKSVDFSSLQYKIVSEATHLPQQMYSGNQHPLMGSSIQSVAACFMLCACLAAGMFSLPYLPLDTITSTYSEQSFAFLEINPLSSWD